MFRFTAMFAAALLLFVSSTAAAEDSGHANERAKNIALLQAALDTDISLYTLEILNPSTQFELVQFHEYRLDRVVCETFQDQGRWNPWQKNTMFSRYKQIKSYWLNHPRRGTSPPPNIQKVSTFLSEYDPEIAACADRVLSTF